MNLLLVALLLATQTPGAQDTVAQVLLRLEDDWTVGLTHRDAALFRRLLADGFVYTEDDRTVGREDVLRDVVAGPDTVESAATDPRGRSVAAIGSRTPGYDGAGVGRSSRHTITLCPRGSASHRAP